MESSIACGNSNASPTCRQVIVAAIPAVQDVSELVPAVTVATCIGNPFASGCDTLDVFTARRGIVQGECDQAREKATNASCLLPVGSTTVNGCRIDPFQTACVSFDAFAGDKCTARPFDTGCEDSTYDTARNNSCTSPTEFNYNVFNVNCTETAYTGTDDARKTFADECRTTTTRPLPAGCSVAVSGVADAPTIADCNANPYATGCDATIFADALTAYCADGAPTIFNTNCDSRANIATARSVAIGVCVAALTTDKTDASCTDTVIVAGVDEDTDAGTPAIPAVTVGSCLDDPFHTACNSNPLFQFARDDHMEVCMSNGNANLPSCATLAAAEPCVRNPFLASCMTATVGNRFRNARAARYAFCEGARAGSAASVASGDTDLCGSQGAGGTGTTIRGEICSYGGGAEGARLNPFAGVCSDNTYVSSKRYYCGVGGRRASDANCNDIVATGSVNTADGCLANPFSATCTTNAGDTITTELRTFLITQRTAYCTDNVGDKDFQVSLCQTSGGDNNALDSDIDFASRVCEGLGEDANPFAPFCVRDNNGFDADRVEFVEACGALGAGVTRLGANADGATCSAEVIACYAAPFVAGTDATDCINEPAYAMARQSVVDRCVTAVTTDSSTAAANADCVTIAGVGQLTCITTNPYENREASTGVTALNCADNSNYDTLRNTLETVTCLASGTPGDTRCGALVANVCGTGADDTAVVGTNPFNANYCFAQDNTFDTQRKTLIDSCDGTSTENGCTAEINFCINNPFNTVVADGVSADCTAGGYPDALVDRRITYCGTGATSGNNSDEANISTAECQTFAITTLASTNPCVANPFGDFDQSGTACADTHIGGDITEAQELRTTYCSGLTDSTSAGIRADVGNPNALCFGAVENFCKGDNLFASASGAGVFDCLTDAEYNTPRAMQYDLCNGDMASRANMDCDSTAVAICTNATIAEADPFAPICTETSTLDAGNVMTARQAVVAECAPLDAGARGLNPRCGRTVTDSTPNNSVTEILATCDRDPREGACDDYASTGHFNTQRLARYASGCAGATALTGGNQEALCPADAVRTAICTDAGANARPFAPICTQTTDVAGIRDVRGRTLDNCLNDRTITTGPCATEDGRAGASITAADSACLGATSSDNPFNAAVTTVPGFTTFNCNSYAAFNPSRNTYATECRKGTTGFNCVGVEGAIDLICETSTGSAANPFDTTICTTPDAGAKLAYANSCVNQVSTTPLGDGTVCESAVIECANNPFGSTCVLTGTTTVDPAYNAQKRVVLGLCDSAEKIIANVGGRCDDAVDDVPCLKDPINCSGTVSEFTEATGGPGTYLITLRQNRYEYCNIRDNINAQPAICRTAATAPSFCIRNPFDPGCTASGNRLGNDLAGYRATRLAYCRGLSGAEANANNSNNGGGVGAGHTSNAGASINLCNVSDRTHDAAGIICGDRDPLTTAVDAALGVTRDPFLDFCSQLTEYDSVRLTRITDCAGFSDPGATGTTVCNWARQVNLCANTDTALNAQCGTLNDLTKWKDGSTGDYDPVELTNLGAGDANEFVTDITLDTTFEYLTLAATPAVSASAVGAAISYGSTFPSVTVFSARKKQVLYSCSADNDNDRNSSCSTGPNGITLSDGSTATVGAVKDPAGEQRFYARINTGGNVGRPVFNRNNAAATWNGRIQWIGNGTFAGGTDRSNFQMKVDFAARTIQGAASIAETNVPGTGNHLVIDGTYTDAGIISGSTSLRDYTANPNLDSNAINIGATINGSASEPGFVSGIIGHLGAVGAFISSTDSNANGYAGGFIVCSAVTNATCRPPPN